MCCMLLYHTDCTLQILVSYKLTEFKIVFKLCSKVCLTCRALRTVMSWNISLAEWGEGAALKPSWRAAACEIWYKQYKKRYIWLIDCSKQTCLLCSLFWEITRKVETYSGEAMKFLTLIRRDDAIQDDSLWTVQGRGCHGYPDVIKREFVASFRSRCWFDFWNSTSFVSLN